MFIKFNINVAIFLGAFISAILVYYAGNLYGPGLTFDSINYLYAGVSLSESGKLIRPQEQPYFQWPPLYPFIIALLNSIPGNLLKTIFYFQIVITGLTVWISGKLAQHLMQNTSIFMVAYVAIVFSSPLILVNHFVWSESFFLLLTLIYTYFLILYNRKPSLLIWWVIILVGSLICLQRQVGIFFVAGGVLLIWRFAQSQSYLYTIASGILHGLLALLPILIWWFRNYMIEGLIMNDYRPGLFKTPFTFHLISYNNVFTSWFLPDELLVWIRIAFTYGVILFLIIKNVQHPSFAINRKYEFITVGVLFCTYFILTYIASYAVGEPMDDRILAPIYIPGLLLFFRLLDGYINIINKFRRKWIVFACILWTLYPVVRTIHNVHFWHNTPVQPPAEQPVEEEFHEKLKF